MNLPGSNPRCRPWSIRLWIGSAWLLLLFAPLVWRRAPPGTVFSLPETPLDRVSPPAAEQWKFLADAARVLPAKVGYTVVAPDPEVETNLYMMSFGLFPRGVAYPTSYYGHPLQWGRRADYVLDFGCRNADSPDRRLVARVRGGCVEQVRSPLR